MRIRDVINLLEQSEQTFFHGSRRFIRKGTVLRSRPGGYVQENDVETKKLERFLEKHRPETCLSRLTAVFMVDDPDNIELAGGYEDYIYTVQTSGQVTKCNLSWYGELYKEAFGRLGTKKHIEMAHNYWTGEPGPRNLYEYLTDAALIIDWVGGYQKEALEKRRAAGPQPDQPM